MDTITKAKFTDDVLSHLAKVGGRQSVSYLLQELRQVYGWRGFSNLADFEDELEGAGFALERVYRKPRPHCHTDLVRATYVTV